MRSTFLSTKPDWVKYQLVSKKGTEGGALKLKWRYPWEQLFTAALTVGRAGKSEFLHRPVPMAKKKPAIHTIMTSRMDWHSGTAVGINMWDRIILQTLCLWSEKEWPN